MKRVLLVVLAMLIIVCGIFFEPIIEFAFPGKSGGIMELFNTVVIGDYTVKQLIYWLLIALCAIVVNTIFKFILERRKKSEDDKESGGRQSFLGLLINCTILPVRLLVWSVAFLLFLMVVDKEQAGALDVFRKISTVLQSLSLAVFLYKLVDIVEYYMQRYAETTETKLDDMLVPAIRKALRVLVLILAGLHVYGAFYTEPLTSVLAGLGIGGLAFALASQDTLKNLFGFTMILADRPFMIGDRINFGGHDGVVESVGMRSTRIRRLDGHLVTVPNAKVADDAIHNIGKRPYIKRVMNITITYDTPVDKIQKAVDIIKDILKDHEGMDPELPPQVYFNEFNADSLNIFALYWYHPPAYWDYMAHAEKVNFELMRRFEEEGIEFAFPTQTVYLAGDPKRELVVKQMLEPKAE